MVSDVSECLGAKEEALFVFYAIACFAGGPEFLVYGEVNLAEVNGPIEDASCNSALGIVFEFGSIVL